MWRALVLLLVVLGCTTDPVHEEDVAELGPESSGVRPGPLHRPGQPCLVCHSEGGQPPVFSVAGTIYRRKGKSEGANKVDVLLVDAAKRVFHVKTNCAGNFYVTPGEYTPTYPMWVTVSIGDYSSDMASRIYREGSCAGCHVKPTGPQSPGEVFLADNDDSEAMVPPTACPR